MNLLPIFQGWREIQKEKCLQFLYTEGISVDFLRNFMTMRRGRDSNPRYPFEYTHFPGVLLQPLGHLSVSSLMRSKQAPLPAISFSHEGRKNTISSLTFRIFFAHSPSSPAPPPPAKQPSLPPAQRQHISDSCSHSASP